MHAGGSGAVRSSVAHGVDYISHSLGEGSRADTQWDLCLRRGGVMRAGRGNNRVVPLARVRRISADTPVGLHILASQPGNTRYIPTWYLLYTFAT